MALPVNFQFSQGSLQDYVDCPRRFQLKHVQKTAWPAAETDSAMKSELHLQQGVNFHRMIHQYFLGVSAETLTKTAAGDQELSRWWENFLQAVDGSTILPNAASGRTPVLFPETSLSVPTGSWRLTGKFDLLAVAKDHFYIFDWKTSRNHPKREWVAKSLQTRTYPYLLAKSSFSVQQPACKPHPDQIEMIYWYANFPARPIRLPYSVSQMENDESYLTNLIDEINALGDEPAPLTNNEKRCNYCVYRSLCNRGVQAGASTTPDDIEEDGILEFDFDFEQIAEIEF